MALVPVRMPKPCQVDSSKSRKKRDEPEGGNIDQVSGIQYLCFTDCLAISADLSTGIEVTDPETCDAIELIQGRYWRIGTVNKFPVYRQEAALTDANVNVNDKELFFYKSKTHDGWFISSDMHEIKKTSTHYMWCPHDETNGVPDIAKVHVPYWQKKPQSIITISTQHEHAGKIIDELVTKNVSRHPQPVGGGGWLNKCGRLAAAIKNSDWKKADELIKEYEDNSELFTNIVVKKRKHY